MNIAKILIVFVLLIQMAYSEANKYFPTLGEYKILGDKVFEKSKIDTNIKPKYDEGAASIEGFIVYLQSALRHDNLDEQKVKEQFDLIKIKLTPLINLINVETKQPRETTIRDRAYSVSQLSNIDATFLKDPLALNKLWEEIFKYFNRLHDEHIRANEEDIKQLEQYKWKK